MLPSKIGIVPVILGLHAEIQFAVNIQKAGGLHPLNPLIFHIFFQVRRLAIDHIHAPVSCVGQGFRRIAHRFQPPDICRTALVVPGATVCTAILRPGHGPHIPFPAVVPETVQQNLLYVIRPLIRRFCLGIQIIISGLAREPCAFLDVHDGFPLFSHYICLFREKQSLCCHCINDTSATLAAIPARVARRAPGRV